MPMITKLTRVVVYHEELPPIKSHDRLVTCLAISCDKLKTSPLPKCLLSTNLVGW